MCCSFGSTRLVGSKCSLSRVMFAASLLHIYIVLAATGRIVTHGANRLIGPITGITVPLERLENLWWDCLARTLLITVSPFCTAFAGGNEVGSWKQQLVCILVPGEMCIYMLCMFIHVVITQHFFDAQASLSLYAGFKCYLHGQDFEMFGL